MRILVLRALGLGDLAAAVPALRGIVRAGLGDLVVLATPVGRMCTDPAGKRLRELLSEHNRDFQLAVAPVRLAGTSGGPVNPIATF